MLQVYACCYGSMTVVSNVHSIEASKQRVVLVRGGEARGEAVVEVRSLSKSIGSCSQCILTS